MDPSPQTYYLKNLIGLYNRLIIEVPDNDLLKEKNNKAVTHKFGEKFNEVYLQAQLSNLKHF